MIRKQIGLLALGVAAVLSMGQLPLVAQEPAPAKPAVPAPKKKADPAHRVPAYFGQIGLTTEQRASIYNLRAKRQEKIQALEKQIATEKAEMMAEAEAVLTETQRNLLVNLRRAAAEANTRPTKPAEPAKAGN